MKIFLRTGIGLVMALVMVMPSLVDAATFKTGSAFDLDDVATKGDVYVSGSHFTSSAPIDGDIIAIGGTATITSDVADDLLVVTGTAHVGGEIVDDARVISGRITFSSIVGGDALLTGGQIKITEDADLFGSLYVSGGIIEMAGTVDKLLEIRGKDVRVSGTVFGDVAIEAERLTIMETARIFGNIDYISPNSIEIREGSRVVGVVNHIDTSNSGRNRKFLGLFTTGDLTRFALILVSAIFLVLSFQRLSYRLVEATADDFLKNTWQGFIFLLIVPGLILLFLATIVGIPLAMMVLGGYIVTTTIALLFASVTAGALVYKHLSKSKQLRVTALSSVIGVVLMLFVGLIPFVGQVVWAVFFVAGLGALNAIFFSVLRKYR